MGRHPGRRSASTEPDYSELNGWLGVLRNPNCTLAERLEAFDEVSQTKPLPDFARESLKAYKPQLMSQLKREVEVIGRRVRYVATVDGDVKRFLP
ncbi:MAG: hypothetical protein M3Q75_13495 [Gemmatimonadota bacterium]|nr:hypothetical protein [Gemmatimonadota bacterium]